MKKQINKLALIISGILVSTSALAFDNEQHNENQKLSEIRTEISQTALNNQLSDLKIKGLEKQKEIQMLKDQINGVVSTPSGTTKETIVDYSLPLDTNITDEDILSQDNNWEQNVGFIYQNSLPTNNTATNSPVDKLTDESPKAEDASFEKMLKEIGDSLEKNKDTETTDEVVTTAIPKTEFKLNGIDLSSLNIFGDDKDATLKVNYLSNNGFQKVKGAKIINIAEGKTYNVKNQFKFKVLSISDNGVQIEDLSTKTKQLISK